MESVRRYLNLSAHWDTCTADSRYLKIYMTRTHLISNLKEEKIDFFIVL